MNKRKGVIDMTGRTSRSESLYTRIRALLASNPTKAYNRGGILNLWFDKLSPTEKDMMYWKVAHALEFLEEDGLAKSFSEGNSIYYQIVRRA